MEITDIKLVAASVRKLKSMTKFTRDGEMLHCPTCNGEDFILLGGNRYRCTFCHAVVEVS